MFRIFDIENEVDEEGIIPRLNFGDLNEELNVEDGDDDEADIVVGRTTGLNIGNLNEETETTPVRMEIVENNEDEEIQKRIDIEDEELEKRVANFFKKKKKKSKKSKNKKMMEILSKRGRKT